MMSTILRNAVRDLLVASTDLNGLGYDANSILPNFSPDAPATQFCVMRWGTTVTGIGPVGRTGLALWFYNQIPDFAPIIDAIKYTKALMPTLSGSKLGTDVAVLDVKWEGDSDDLFDDGYRAVVRYSSFTLTASGS